MNVKPGDLAQIVKAARNFEWTLGRVVRISHPCCFAGGVRAWRFEDDITNGRASIHCAPDAYLVRIPPLTEDQVQDTRAELPVPTEPTTPKRRRIPIIEHV